MWVYCPGYLAREPSLASNNPASGDGHDRLPYLMCWHLLASLMSSLGFGTRYSSPTRVRRLSCLQDYSSPELHQLRRLRSHQKGSLHSNEPDVSLVLEVFARNRYPPRFGGSLAVALPTVASSAQGMSVFGVFSLRFPVVVHVR